MATVEKLMRLKVVTPEQVVFEGTARSLVAPAWDGWVGILPGHAPFLTLMGEGAVVRGARVGGQAGVHGEGVAANRRGEAGSERRV